MAGALRSAFDSPARGLRVGTKASALHQAVLSSFGLAADDDSLNQLRYDLRKMKGHALIERVDHGYLYRLIYQIRGDCGQLVSAGDPLFPSAVWGKA